MAAVSGTVNEVQPYVYEALHSSWSIRDPALRIRVLRIQPGDDKSIIQCSLEQQKLESNHYCLSYTWGSSDLAQRQITINGKSFKVRENLWQFLHTARRYRFREPIWIDAICINQADVWERNEQVSLMDRIYGRAKVVVVWLGLTDCELEYLTMLQDLLDDGPPASIKTNGSLADAWHTLCKAQWKDLDLEDKVELLSGQEVRKNALMQARRTSTEVNSLGKQKTHLTATDRAFWRDHLSLRRVGLKFMSAAYWRRVWVLQELLLPLKANLLTSHGTLDVPSLYTFLLHYMRGTFEEDFNDSLEWHQYVLNEIRDDDSPLSWLSYYLEVYRTGSRQPVDHFDHPMPIKQLDMEGALRATRGRDCHDLRDRIYGILSLVKGWEDFSVGYHHAKEQVWWDLITHAIYRCRDAVPYHQHLAKALRALPNLAYKALEIDLTSQCLMRSVLDFVIECNATERCDKVCIVKDLQRPAPTDSRNMRQGVGICFWYMTGDVQLIFELSSLVFSEFKCHWDLLGAFSPKVVRVWEYDKDEVWKLIDMETVANTEDWDGRQYLVT